MIFVKSISSKQGFRRNNFLNMKVLIAGVCVILSTISCSPKEVSSTQRDHSASLNSMSTVEKLFVPKPCTAAGSYIYQDLRLEKYRDRYNEATLQALVNLTVCLNKNGYEKEASEIGLEVLLLSEIAYKKPNDIDFVAQIVSDSRYHGFAIRAWADWTYISEKEEGSEGVPKLSSSDYRIRSKMMTSRRIALGLYFRQLQEIENDHTNHQNLR